MLGLVGLGVAQTPLSIVRAEVTAPRLGTLVSATMFDGTEAQAIPMEGGQDGPLTFQLALQDATQVQALELRYEDGSVECPTSMVVHRALCRPLPPGP